MTTTTPEALRGAIDLLRRDRQSLADSERRPSGKPFTVEALGWLAEYDDAIKAVEALHAECEALRKSLALVQQHHATAWNRGHAAGLAANQQIARQAQDAVARDAWGNTQLTESLLAAEAERDALRADAERYRWLRDLKCCSFTLGHNDAHAPSYMTASDWIDDNPEWFADTPDAELRRMRDSNTIWTLRVYPRTPVGFDMWCAATLDAAIDAARAAKEQSNG